MLYSTQPDTKGKAATIARSRQLTEFVWTPLSDVPSYAKGEYSPLKAGECVRGIPYSSTEISDKFITENVSFESFLTMVANPDSALYNKSYNGGYDGKIWTFTGLVCNGLVRYSYNIERRVSTKRWMQIPGMRMIARHGEYSAEDIQLCDNLYAFGEGRSHVALITDLFRDETGEVKLIEVSEAIRKSCQRRLFAVEEFFEKYKLFNLCRYDFVDKTPYPDEDSERLLFESELHKILPKIAVDYGNKSNYRVGEDVTISVYAEGEDAVLIKRSGKLVEEIATSGRARIVRSLDRGYYTAELKNGGTGVEFAVTKPETDFTVNGDEITVTYNSHDPESELLYMDFREKNPGCTYSSLCEIIEVTPEEKAKRTITRKIPDIAGSYKLYFKNKYGVWTHNMITI